MYGKMNRYILLATMAIIMQVMTGCSQDNKDQQTSNIKRPTPPEVTTIKGKVIETVDAGSFMYVLLDLGEKQTWAAVPPVDVEIGEDVTLRNANYFNNFYSKSLQRSFEVMIFSSGIEGKKPKRREAALDNKGNPINRRSTRMMMPSLPAKPKVQANTSAEPSPAKEK